MKSTPPAGVIFDLDGVITRTASVHSAAWKLMFDEYLRERENRYGEPFREFTHGTDYLSCVDGKPRYKGVASFLESRGISLEWGSPDDSLESETVCGIGNRKNIAFNEILERDGAEVFETSVELLHELREAGVRIGVASSSKNCRTVLEVTGLLPLVETIIGGVESAERGLKGKPDPDIFTTAADELGLEYHDCVVVEDAVSGVQAGRAGNFGLVLGVARDDNEQALLEGGADLVVRDLGDVDLDDLREWFDEDLRADGWQLSYHGFEPKSEKHRETLLTVGNGYLATRGAIEGSSAGPAHYPATYIAGVADRATSKVGDREVENEDLVNCVDWLPMSFRLDGGEWFNSDTWEIVEQERVLYLQSATLWQRLIARDRQGRAVEVESNRVVSMESPHLLGLSYRVTPLEQGAEITIRSGLRGDLINDGVARYRSLERRHLEHVEVAAHGAESSLVTRTRESGITIAAAAKLAVSVGGQAVESEYLTSTTNRRADTETSVSVAAGQHLVASKTVAIHTSRDCPEPLAASRQLVEDNGSVELIMVESAQSWSEIWSQLDVEIEGDRLAQKLIRLHLYHLMTAGSPHIEGLDVSVTARGLHGEAYRGHIFWDELFLLPLYAMHFPAVSREMLMYRYRRLDQARRNALAEGLQGAMFPWQSGSDGREETQVTHLNPLSGHWDPDHSRLQRHVSLAVAYDIWQHAWICDDKQMLAGPGGEMLLEICRFWASKAERDVSTGRFHIRGVMGPDEFHEKLPNVEEGGLTDNSYTNVMVVWLLRVALKVLSELDEAARHSLTERVGLTSEETTRWKEITRRMNLVISDEGILAQFDGYFELEELDWDHYRRSYDDIHRMDRILKAEGKSPDAFKVAKQADTLMLFYLLPIDEVTEIIRGLGYDPGPGYVQRNFDYYFARTSHGSTLSRVVHAHLAGLLGDDELSWQLYREALTSDYVDIQGGSTAEGIHTGVMAGTVIGALRSYAGLDLNSAVVALNPRLPKQWRRMAFSFRHRGARYEVQIEKHLIRVRIAAEDGLPRQLRARETVHLLTLGEWSEIEV